MSSDKSLNDTDDDSRRALVIEECIGRWTEGQDTARRLFHGRGHAYPGLEDLTVDRFGSTLHISCFGDDLTRAGLIAETLASTLPGVTGVSLQHRQGRGTTAEVVAGQVPEELVVEEDGLKYLVAPLRNQNVGLFLDMAPIRRWLRERSEGKRVLNLFAYTCAFSVAAIAGGAARVLNNDMSRPALDWGKRNHELNDHDLRKVRMLPHNLFKSWSKIREFGPYDILIVDPPTNQRGSFNAEKQYGQVLKRIVDSAAPGALIIACLNSPFLNSDFVPAQMARWCPRARFVDDMPASADFPDQFPDRGLKIGRYVVD